MLLSTVSLNSIAYSSMAVSVISHLMLLKEISRRVFVFEVKFFLLMLLRLVVFLLLMLFIRVQIGIYFALIRNTKFYVDTIVNIFLWEMLLSIMFLVS